MSTLKAGIMKRAKRERGLSSAAEGAIRSRKLSRVEENADSVRGCHVDDTDDCEDVQGTPDPIRDRYSLRSRYEALRVQVSSSKAQLAETDNSRFKDILATAEVLHKYVRKPREQVKDAEVHIGISTELLDVAKSARMKGGISCDEFLGAIMNKYGVSVGDGLGKMIDLEALGRAACGVVRLAPGLSTMVGPMDVERKPRARPRATQDRTTRVIHPGKVADADPDAPSTETDVNIQTMFGLLRARKRVLFDHLVLNRHSFSQTVENTFALLFLIKDGRVEIKKRADNLLEVAPRNAPTHAQRTSGEVKNSQFVFNTSMRCWRIMRERIPEGAEIMPHRGVLDSGEAGEEDCIRLCDEEQDEPSASCRPIRKSQRN